MELTRAIRLDQMTQPPMVAFVGAGGKSAAIFECARRLGGPVIVTTTSHLAENQLNFANRHYFENEVLGDRFERKISDGVTLITGPLQVGSERVLGINEKSLARLHTLSVTRQIPILIESDGSRRLPLKAPADHEPPIPPFVTAVIVVAGLSGLGRPLSAQWVHRPNFFSTLSGLGLGEKIKPVDLARVMTHPDGGLKNVPQNANRIALLNQADTLELQALMNSQLPTLFQQYQSVVISALKPRATIHAVHQPISAVILAAGESRRFGRPKLLLDWGGKPLIWHVVNKALLTNLDPVVVVCGQEMDSIQQILSGLPVEIVYNSNWREGQGASVRIGIQSVRSRSKGVLFMLADQPQVQVMLIRHLIERHAQHMSPITGPMVDGTRGNPVLFDWVTFEDLADLSGAQGGRKLFGKYKVDWVPWNDLTPLLDVDTPEDYDELLEMEI